MRACIIVDTINPQFAFLSSTPDVLSTFRVSVLLRWFPVVNRKPREAPAAICKMYADPRARFFKVKDGIFRIVIRHVGQRVSIVQSGMNADLANPTESRQ